MTNQKPSQREFFLEKIAEQIHPFVLEQGIPQVYVVGSMGAGKSSLIHGIHNQLRYTNRGLVIDQCRVLPNKEEVYQYIKETGIHRKNATFFPETSIVYTHSAGGIIPLEMQAEGSHPKAEKLFARETAPSAVVFCLDLLLLAHLWDERTVIQNRGTHQDSKLFNAYMFKCEPNYPVFISLLEALDHAAYWKEQDIPVLAVGTQYQKLIDRAEGKDNDFALRLTNNADVNAELGDNVPELIRTELDLQARLCSDLLSALSNGQILKRAQEIINGRKTGTERADYATPVQTQALPLPELFPEILFADSRHPSRVGVEEAAYRIARTTLPQFEDLRLISLSHQVPDTERVIKYISLRK